MIRPHLTYVAKSIDGALRTARRPAAKFGVSIAILLFACCFTRSDAQVEGAKHPALDVTHIVGTWNGNGAAQMAQGAIDDAKANGVVASAQSMYATPTNDASMTTRVAPLRIDTQIHARRVFDDARPAVRFSPHLAPGERRMVRAGTPGITWVTERITYWNDVVVSRQTIAREVVRSAQPGVMLVGTPKTLAQLRTAFPGRSLSTALTMEATAYTADSATAYPTGYTATGVLAREGVVAVDPHVIPLGTMLFVPGYGIAVAADTGGAIVGNRIDLCMDSYGDAVNFGRKMVQVYILKR